MAKHGFHQMPSKALSIHPGTSSKQEAKKQRHPLQMAGAPRCKISGWPGTLMLVDPFAGHLGAWRSLQAEAGRTTTRHNVLGSVEPASMPSGVLSKQISFYRFRLLHRVQQQTNILAGQVSGCSKKGHKTPFRRNQPDHPIAACSRNTSSSLIAAGSTLPETEPVKFTQQKLLHSLI